MKKQLFSFIINIALLFTGVVMAFTDLLIQVNYHMGNHGGIDASNFVLGISYAGWSYLHKMSIIFISILMIFHIILHWKWFSIIVQKNLIAKNKQVIVLSIVFVIVAITGYIPWLMKLIGGAATIRKIFIEIHDKLAIVLCIYLILHIYKRFKWFIVSANKLR